MNLPNTLVYFVVLNLLFGSLSCDNDDPASVCYVAQILNTTPADVNQQGFTRFSYDDHDRITKFEYRTSSATCTSSIMFEMVWEDDRITKIIETYPFGSACNLHTQEHIILYENDLVGKIDDFMEFTYDDDLNLSEIYFPVLRLTYSFQYDSDKNVRSQQQGPDFIEYSYDTNPNYLSPVVKALGDQPALAYYIWFGVTALSANNVVTEKGPHTDRRISYGFNENRFVVEQFETTVEGIKFQIMTMEYGTCK